MAKPQRTALAAADLHPVQLEFAWSPDRNSLVHISEARHGESFQHPDPALRTPLIARKGLLRRHHFANHGNIGARSEEAATVGGAGGEGLRHLNFKLSIAHHLQNHADIALRWECPGCERVRQTNLREHLAFDAAPWETPFQTFRLDVGLLHSGRPVGAIEVFDTHAVDFAKQQAFFAAAGSGDRFQAFEIHAAATPLQPPLRVHSAIPPLLCENCRARRDAWLAWAKTAIPAVNFSGWTELPAPIQGCLCLGGGWGTRLEKSEALTPVFYWLEIQPRLDREIIVTAQTLHRKNGLLRWRELRLRAPGGQPSAELTYQLRQAANGFAKAAASYRQRLSRIDTGQLLRWRAQLRTAIPIPGGQTTPLAPVAKTGPPPLAATPRASNFRPESPIPPRPPPQQTPSTAAAPDLPARPRARPLATWIDRLDGLAHRAADWLDARPCES